MTYHERDLDIEKKHKDSKEEYPQKETVSIITIFLILTIFLAVGVTILKLFVIN